MCAKLTKMELIIILTILTVSPLVESDEHIHASSLRGSLLFEQLAFRPITVNPHYFNFYRQFNMTHILTALNVLTEYEKLYSRLCNDIAHMPELTSEFFITTHNKTSDPFRACLRSGGYLPEVRSRQEAKLLNQLMQNNNLTQIPAGVEIVNNKLIYKSDKSDLSTAIKLQYCPVTCPLLSDQLHAHKFETLFNNYYKIPPNVPAYRTLDETVVLAPTEITGTTIVCMKNREAGLTALHYMLRSSCNRDTQEIREQNRLLSTEISHFLSPKPFTLFDQEHRDLNENVPRHLNKRSPIIPLVALSLLGGAITRKSPLDALGSLGASIFGLGTKDDMIITKQKLQEHAIQISNLAINQDLIEKAINDINIHINSLAQFNNFASHKIAQAYAELDNKGLIRHLQNLIQLTLLKMQSAINAATQSIPSPYVFSNKDLQNITHTFRMNDILLTTNLNEISASVLIVEDQLTFMFNVPVNDHRNKFNFYEVRQLPVFMNNKSYKIDIANKFIGINVFTNEYILLSQTEFQRCLILPICTLPSPFIRITEQSPCEVLTFKDNIQTCPLVETLNSSPVFYTYKNTTMYSIPHSVQVHITCKQGRQVQSTYRKISGMGTFDMTPGCSIHIPPNTNIRPEYMIGQQALSSDTLMGTIKDYTKDSAFLPLLLNVSTSTIKPLKINDVTTFQQGIELIFNHEQLTTEVVRIIAYLIIAILILYSLTCCFPKLKLWLKSFCLITKPEKYWGMRKYIIPSPFIRQNKVNKPTGDPLETYVSTFRQRLAKLINRPSQSEDPNFKKPDLDLDNDAEITNDISFRYPKLPEYNSNINK